MSVVNGFQVGSETLKYNYESLENYNTPDFSNDTSVVYDIGDYVMYNGKLYKCVTTTTGGTWNNSDWEASILTEDINDIKNDIINLNSHLSDIATDLEEVTDGLNTKAPVILETASGAIASFSDGADNMPIKKLVANIEPVQDLHGYDSPWPAGGGVNKWDEEWEVGSYSLVDGSKLPRQSTQIRCKNLIPVTPSETYYFVTPNASYMWFAFFDENQTILTSGLPTNAVNASDNGRAFVNVAVTMPNTCHYIVFYTQPDYGGTYQNNIAINYPATITTYAPYSNICPISGHTGAKVTRTGKNLFDDTGLMDFSNWIADTGGYSRFSFHLPPGTYSINFIGQPSGYAYIGIIRNGSATESIFMITTGAFGTSFTVTKNDELYLRLTVHSQASLESFFANGYISVSKNTPLPKEKSIVTTISVTFPTEAGDNGTVYSGSATYNGDETWNLIVDSAIKTLVGTEYTWTVYGNALYRSDIIPDMIDTGNNRIPGICSAVGQYLYDPTQLDEAFLRRTGINSKGLEFRDVKTKWGLSEVTSEALNSKLAEMNSDGKPLQILYKIQPRSYTISTEQLLSTLYGTNNIWSSTGDVEVEYPADTRLYIEKLTQPTEDDMTANTNIDINKFFMVGNSLYFSTVAIAAGETIVPGTNCNLVSLADALNQINV